MSDDEKERGEGRFFVLKARNEQDGTIVTFTHDFSRTMIQTTGVQRPVAEKKKRDRESSGPMANAEAAVKRGQMRKKEERENI